MTDPTPIVFSDPHYDGQLVRTLTMATVHAADLGEALAAARRVGKPDRDAWHDSWHRNRIAALVCDPAQPEMADRLPKGPGARLAAPVVRFQMRRNPRRREFFGARMATHGLTGVGAYFAELRRYSILSLADRITCPTLVVEAEGDVAGGSGARLVEAMTAPTELVRLTALPR